MQRSLGWRGRIGLIYPNCGLVMEPECYAMAPPGVTIHTQRLHLTRMTVDGVAKMMASDESERCARMLAKAPLDAIMFGGTSASFLNGIGYDEEVRLRLQRAADGIPVTTTSGAVLKALRSLEVTRLSFVSPYDEPLTQIGRRFFEQNGFHVVSAVGLGMHTDLEMFRTSLAELYAYARRSTPADAHGIFIACTGLRSVGLIEALEHDLKIPVVSAVQATFWDALRIAGIRSQRSGFGRLYQL